MAPGLKGVSVQAGELPKLDSLLLLQFIAAVGSTRQEKGGTIYPTAMHIQFPHHLKVLIIKVNFSNLGNRGEISMLAMVWSGQLFIFELTLLRKRVEAVKLIINQVIHNLHVYFSLFTLGFMFISN